jgi:excinuclease ABC subunit B
MARVPQTVFVSATPDEWEIKQAGGKVVEQLIRPTGLVDPQVEIHPTQNQIQDLIKEIILRKKKNERVLVTTLTKKMAEELSNYLSEINHTGESLNIHYLHADVETLVRSDILRDLRLGKYDVIVGVNLLREGLDLPEVSLVAILDADKQGFLRSKISLIQTMGRAARNVGSKVILYADEVSWAMKGAIEEVSRRRQVQLTYNKKHHIIPQTIQKPIRDRLVEKPDVQDEINIDEEGLIPGEAKKLIVKLNRKMREYAKLLEFEQAAKARDRIEKIKEKFDL